MLYGSGITNLAKVCGVTPAKMRKMIARFEAELPALPALKARLEAVAEKVGYIHAVDARWGRIRSKNGKLLVHTLLNVLLQMTGSIAMKYSLCFAERQMLDEGVGLDEAGYVAWLANVHDEYQAEVDADEVEYKEYRVPNWKAEEKLEHYDEQGRMWSAPTLIEKGDDYAIVARQYHRAGEIMAKTMTKAGEFLKMRLPLAGEYKIGDSWHDTH